jgi:FMN-dependent NADH-azoreductase
MKDDDRNLYSHPPACTLEQATPDRQPVNNFCVPSTLKAWVDHIVRIRRMFQSTPEGLLHNRPVDAATAHGGDVTNPPMQSDFPTPCLQAIFETIGIRSLEFVRLEGVARGPEAVTRARCRGRLDQAAVAQLLGDR